MKDWIVLGRPHTASLTIPGTLLGAVVAGATDPLLYALLGTWALLFHYFGFIHNNLADLPHDRADPSKQHFPLVSGAIDPGAARRYWILGTLVVEVLGLGLAAWSGADSLGAFLALQAAVGLGAAYNVLSKRWKGGPFLISVSYAALAAFAYFAAGGAPGALVLWYVVAYGFVLMLHQIAYAGYLKDLAPDPVNWLRSWGARAEPVEPGVYTYVFPPAVQAWAWASRLLCPVLAFAYVGTALPREAWALAFPAMALWTALMVVVFRRLVRPGTFPRQRKLAGMGASEVLAYFLLVASLHGVLGTWALAFYVGPLAWFVAWNRLLWGTNLGPRV